MTRPCDGLNFTLLPNNDSQRFVNKFKRFYLVVNKDPRDQAVFSVESANDKTLQPLHSRKIPYSHKKNNFEQKERNVFVMTQQEKALSTGIQKR